ncbi:dTDP-glucose 4,6-dehydratase [Tardiphaga sp. 11_C7_N12_6]|uniref:dTDP-glucose 4,6-dehydratase n=1 Tax=Tardiphaga sp. 11_C7_N12_6 TaxID=3240789 RepID=UPI003F29B032
MRVVVTGGAGFIGSAVVRRLIQTDHDVLNIDKLTYAGRVETLNDVATSPRYRFAQIDITDRAAVADAFASFDPELVLHLAAESHVDRSIENSSVFITTNIVGTHVMLECALRHWSALASRRQSGFRFVHVSTDEVYGTLGVEGFFSEDSAFAPNSPYAASKAAADHLARAWYQTYGLPVIATNCSNNYGPWQHPEKLLPTILRNAVSELPIPIYGTGDNVRDWLFVEDHVDGLLLAASAGRPGERYNFGGDGERSNLQIARAICGILDEICPRTGGQSHLDAITFVADRPGHDFRYAVDASKAKRELGWVSAHDFESGLTRTIQWYLSNPIWFARSDNELGRRGLIGEP